MIKNFDYWKLSFFTLLLSIVTSSLCLFSASVSSLDGFLITVHIHFDDFPHGPYCFHANLSGTDWTAVRDPHVS